MSRETKIGLVVSCSFLCLVGTVVYLKLKQGAFWPSTDGDADAALVASEGPPAEPEPAAEAGKPQQNRKTPDDESTSPSGTQRQAAPGSETDSPGDEQASDSATTDGPVVPAAATSQPATLRVDPASAAPITTPASTSTTKTTTTPGPEQKRTSVTPAAEPPAPQFDDTDTTDETDTDQSKPAGAGAVSSQSTATASPNTQSTKAKTEQPATVQKDPAKPMATPKRETADASHDAIVPPPAFPNSNDPFKKLPDPPEDLDGTSGAGGSPPASEFAKDGVNSKDAPSSSRSTGVREQASDARMEQSPAATQSPDSSASTPA